MINLWYDDSKLHGRMSGPLKVIVNLKESLLESKIDYSVNEDVYSKNLLLHYDPIGHQKHERLDHNTCFIGPQFWPFDSYGKFLKDHPEYYNKLIVPSYWVKDLLTLKFGFDESKIKIWPVGVKSSNLNKNIKYDCLVYFKRRSQQELNTVTNFLENKNFSYNVISYGSYHESDFELLTSQSRFCFLLNGTESQGIAVQEIMDSNTPLFVWDLKEWLDEGEEYKVGASSIPYWDDVCGERFFEENEMEETFSKFYDKISSYTPREFVEKNLSYRRSIEILLEILNAN